MAGKRNNFSTGPHGTTITSANSDDVPGNDLLNLAFATGTGSSIKYYDASTLNRATAEYVCESICGAGAGASYVGWDPTSWPGGASAQLWTRFYAYLVSPLPVSTGGTWTSLMQAYSINESEGGFYVYLAVGIDTGGTYELIASNTPSTVTGSLPVVADQWIRIEVRSQFSNASIGNGAIRYYEEADAGLDEFTEEITWSGWDEVGIAANTCTFGYATPASSVDPATAYLSGIEFSDTDWIGPAPFKSKGVPGILTNPIAVHSDTR